VSDRWPVTRRTFLAALVSVAGAGCASAGPAPVTADVGFDRFMALSRLLTGVDDLDPELGRIYYAALGHDEHAAADAVVVAWYTGGIGVGREAAIVTYPGALAWSTLTFTKAPSVCGGGLGFWAAKP
jgi:hypothetical protein